MISKINTIFVVVAASTSTVGRSSACELLANELRYKKPHLLQQPFRFGHEFHIDRSVAEFVNQAGNLFLFRVIAGSYQRGLVGEFSAWEKFYSYSLNPYIFDKWAPRVPVSKGKILVVISEQNIERDNLKFPNKAHNVL